MAEDELPPANLILQALHGIRSDFRDLRSDFSDMRSELKGLNARVDGLNTRVDGLNTRVDSLNTRVTEGFVQTNTKLADLAHTVVKLADNVDTHDKRLNHLLTDGLGAEVRSLSKRVTRLESGRVVRRPTSRKK